MKETVGHHVVRDIRIAHCEQAGIVGSLGAAFSTVSGNTIHDIHVRQLFSGAEMAGIKFHGPIDADDQHHIYLTCRGIWLDWMTQGTRVSGNLCHDNATHDLFVGRRYVGALADEIAKWLRSIPEREPVGVAFSGGIDSGGVFLTTYHVMRQLGMNPSRLKAFTLDLGEGPDLEQARRFLESLGLGLFLEPVEAELADLDVAETIRVVEDYKPLDIEAATMVLALCRGIRERYADWRFLVDGDGGDENFGGYRRYYFDMRENFVRGLLPRSMAGPAFRLLGRVCWTLPYRPRRTAAMNSSSVR